MTDPLITAAQFLQRNLEWMRHATDEQGQAVAVSVFAEIRDCAAKLRSLVEGPAQQKYLGPCGALIVEDYERTEAEGWIDESGTMRTCDGDVYARPGAETGRCRSCGATVRTEDREAWLDEVRREWLYHASEIEQAYPSVKAATIRKWYERGLIAAHGEHQKRPLYKLGEVLDLAAGDAARREEARAERARRAERMSA